jgi:hypothetical protein
MQLVAAILLLAITLAVSLVLYLQKDSGLRPGGWLSRFLFRRIGAPRRGFFEKDLVLVGPINELVSWSVGELIFLALVLAWLAISVAGSYRHLTDDTRGQETLTGNRSRAFGRSIAQASVRLIFLSLASASRNVVLYRFLGVPFERALRFHKMMGRLQICSIIVHVISMLVGEERPLAADRASRLNLVRRRRQAEPQ